MRKVLVSGVLAVIAGAGVVVADVQPASAVTVKVAGSTVTVSQTAGDTGLVSITVLPSGFVEVISNGGTPEVHPARPNLVVNGREGMTLFTVVTLQSALSGSLSFNLPADAVVRVTGDAAQIGGDLWARGSVASQSLELSEIDEVSVAGDVNVDLAGGVDSLTVVHALDIGGSLAVRGANNVAFDGALTVGRDASFQLQPEVMGTEFSASDAFVVGRDFRFSGGHGPDQVHIDAVLGVSQVGGNISMRLGNALFYPGLQSVHLRDLLVLGDVRVVGGQGYNGFSTSASTVISGDLDGKFSGDLSNFWIDGAVGGTSIRYTGSNGEDDVHLWGSAPNARARVMTKGGADRLVFDPATTELLQVIANLGAGVDQLETQGYVLPPNSSVKGLP